MSVTVTSSSSYSMQKQFPQDGLIHQFIFDNNINDSLGNATIVENAPAGFTYGVDPVHGPYVRTNGAAQPTAGWTSTYTFGPTHPASMCAWINPSNDGSNGLVLGEYTFGTYANWHMLLSLYAHGGGYQSYSGYSLRAGNTNTPTSPICKPDSAELYNQWHHLAAVTTGSNSLSLYYDGELVTSTTQSQNGNDNHYLSLGYHATSGNITGDTKYANWLIYSRALTADEIKTIYEMG